MKAPRNRREQVEQFVNTLKAKRVADLSPEDAEKLQSYSWVMRGDECLIIDKDGAEVDPYTLTPVPVWEFWYRIALVVPRILEQPDYLEPDYQVTRGGLDLLHDDEKKALLRGDKEWAQMRADQIKALRHKQDQLVTPPMRQAVKRKKTNSENWHEDALQMYAVYLQKRRQGYSKPDARKAAMKPYGKARRTFFTWQKYAKKHY